jgi:hypothetical protein
MWFENDTFPSLATCRFLLPLFPFCLNSPLLWIYFALLLPIFYFSFPISSFFFPLSSVAEPRLFVSPLAPTSALWVPVFAAFN